MTVFTVHAQRISLLLILVAGIIIHTPTLSAQRLATTIRYETYKKGKLNSDRSGTMVMALQPKKVSINSQQGQNAEMLILFDGQANTLTTVTESDGKKTATVLPLIRLGISNPFVTEATIEKTSETKKILGYTTTKYIVKEKGNTTETWIAELEGVDWSDLVEQLGFFEAGNSSSFVFNFEDMPNAFSLESHSTSKNGKIVTHSYVEKLLINDQVDESYFMIPKDAEVQDMSSLLGF